MNRFLSAFLILMLLIAAAACSGKKTLERSAVQSKNVLSVLKDMTQAYETKNLDSFLSNISQDYPERNKFSQSLADVFARYESIRFNIQYTKMLIMIQDKGQIKVLSNWDAEWTTSTGITSKGGGRITLSFSPDTFKLVAIDGKNPFIPVENPVKQ